MRFKIINKSGIEKASGLVVVIDVLRAFTTACYLFSNGAKEIILIENPKEGMSLKRKYADYVLVGERKGSKIQGFDYGNSPYELKNVDFSNKTIVMTTSQGTACIIELNRIPNIQEIITGSFVNASAVTNYIREKKYKTVTFLCTDSSYVDNEDFMCAKYLESCLKGKPFNFQTIKRNLEAHPTAEGFLREPLTKYAKLDFELCLQLNIFRTIIKSNKSKENIVLRPIEYGLRYA